MVLGVKRGWTNPPQASLPPSSPGVLPAGRLGPAGALPSGPSDGTLLPGTRVWKLWLLCAPLGADVEPWDASATAPEAPPAASQGARLHRSGHRTVRKGYMFFKQFTFIIDNNKKIF